MKTAYHTLTLVSAPEGHVRESIRTWIQTSKFVFRYCNERSARIEAVYKGWCGFGITDSQTGTILEIVVKGTEDLTAVSIYHHTTRFLCITGAVLGDILRREAESLVQYLRDRGEEKR